MQASGCTVLLAAQVRCSAALAASHLHQRQVWRAAVPQVQQKVNIRHLGCREQGEAQQQQLRRAALLPRTRRLRVL